MSGNSGFLFAAQKTLNSIPKKNPPVTSQDGCVAVIAVSDKPGDSLTKDEDFSEKKDSGVIESTNENMKSNSSRNVYSIEFKEKVVNYAKENGMRAAGRKFGVSASSVKFWMWGLEVGFKSKVCKYADFKEKRVDKNSWKEAAHNFDVSQHRVAGLKLTRATANLRKSEGYNVQKELSNESSTEETSGNVYSMEFKQKVVKHAEENGLRAAGRKFQISPSSVRFWKWGIKTGYTPKVRQYADDFKKMVVSFGVDKGWKAAADKFGVEPHSVGMWAKKLGRKRKSFVGDVAKKEIIQYGLEKNSWEEAADKFGVSPHTVKNWKSKAGLKLTRKRADLRRFGPEPDFTTSLLSHTNLLNSEGLAMRSNDDVFSPALENDKCEDCRKALSTAETLTEHVGSIHIPREGLCEICGFKKDLKSLKDFVDQTPLVLIKEECLDVDHNQNYTDFTSSEQVVKEEINEKDESLDGEERWLIDTFYSN